MEFPPFPNTGCRSVTSVTSCEIRVFAINHQLSTINPAMTRRDQCYLVGRRARTCSIAQAAAAWTDLSARIEAMGDLDIPKFRDVLYAIRKATLTGKMINHDPSDPSFGPSVP